MLPFFLPDQRADLALNELDLGVLGLSGRQEMARDLHPRVMPEKHDLVFSDQESRAASHRLDQVPDSHLHIAVHAVSVDPNIPQDLT